MAIVWPCALSVDEYVAAGRDLEVPRPKCPTCSAEMSFWSGYERYVRSQGVCRRVWVRRAQCKPCGHTHALLPAFVVAGRLDDAETIGAALEKLAEGPDGVRPVAEAAAVPHTTARGWWRRFQARAEGLALGFCALGAELGGTLTTASGSVPERALSAMGRAFAAACAFPGWLALSCWRFCNVVAGGSWLATNTNSPYLVVGRRRFMAPVA